MGGEALVPKPIQWKNLKPEDRTKITDTLAAMQKLHDHLEAFHRKWSDYNDGKGLRELEQALSFADAMASEGKDAAKVAEDFTKGSN
jgi:hypothetical protein